MRKILYPLLLLLIPVFCVSAQENIAVNGGFEDAVVGQSSDIEGWTIEIDASANANMSITDEDKYEGNQSMKIFVVTPGNSSWHIQIIQEPVYLDVNGFYRFTLRAKTTPPDSAWMSYTIGAELPGDSYPEMARLGGTSGQKLLGPNEWRLLPLVVKAPYDSLRVPIHFHEENTVFYIDDLQIIESKLAVCEVDESGEVITLNFGWDIAEPSLAFNLSSFEVRANGNVRPVTSLEFGKFGHFVNVLKATIDGRIGEGATVTVSYTKPEAVPLEYDDERAPEDEEGLIPDFTDEPADNLSIAVGVNTFKTPGKLHCYVDRTLDVLSVSGLDDALTMDLYSITGQLVKSIRVDQDHHFIQLSDMNQGVYILRVGYRERAFSNIKFLK